MRSRAQVYSVESHFTNFMLTEDCIGGSILSNLFSCNICIIHPPTVLASSCFVPGPIRFFAFWLQNRTLFYIHQSYRGFLFREARCLPGALSAKSRAVPRPTESWLGTDLGLVGGPPGVGTEMYLEDGRADISSASILAPIVTTKNSSLQNGSSPQEFQVQVQHHTCAQVL